MGKTGKWIRNFLLGEKERASSNNQVALAATVHPTTPVGISVSAPKEKRRWSFRRSSAAASDAVKESKSGDATNIARKEVDVIEQDTDPNKDANVAMSTAHDAAAEVPIRTTTTSVIGNPIEEVAATKIQCVFRSYLARKALRALRGLVKLQALVRGHLVRKQATATLRCMQAIVIAQARAPAQRIRASEEAMTGKPRQLTHRMNTSDNFRRSYKEMDEPQEENIKIVEMDFVETKGSSKSRNRPSNHLQTGRFQHMFLTHQHANPNYETDQFSPAQSAMTDMSPRTCSGHFEDFSFTNIRTPFDSSRTSFALPRPEYAESLSDYPLYPSYMANTESSRAKARSQSAPRQRLESLERQPSRRRPSVEGRNVPRAVRMQRSTSNVGSAVQHYQYPSSIKLEKSTISLKGSECGSTCSVMTNPISRRSLVTYDINIQ